MQRVKVYRLNSDGLWDDKGTGHVSVEFLEQSNSVGLVVISEEDTHRTVLIHRIVHDATYNRQGDDTIITWTDPEIGTDIALSFQEASGCEFIWEQIMNAQNRFHQQRHPGEIGIADGAQRRGIVDEFEEAQMPMEGDFPEGMPSGPVDLPLPEMGNLAEIAKTLSELSPFQQEAGARQMLRPGYIRKLLDMFRQVEDLEDQESLRHLYVIVRGAIMLNDTQLLELLLSEENVMDVVGALEYDPDLPEQQRHREFLREKVVFKEVVPIADAALRAKIHQTYRLAYLKDVVLARVLDDATFATFSSLILFNNIEVVMALMGDARFLPDLFTRLWESRPGDEAWGDQVAFLQELCGLAKHLQAGHRLQLLTKLAGLGLFEVMMAALKHGNDDMRQRATDVLMSAVQHDPAPLREFLLKQPNTEYFQLLLMDCCGKDNEQPNKQAAAQVAKRLESKKQKKLHCSSASNSQPTTQKEEEEDEKALKENLKSLFEPLLEGSNAGLQESVLEIMRALLDPATMPQKAELKPSPQPKQPQQQDANFTNGFLELFYDKYIAQLISVLSESCETKKAAADSGASGAKAAPSALALIVDLLCFCVQQHSYRIKYYVLRNNVVEKVLKLLNRKEKWLVVSAVRFLRTCIGLKDDFYNRYLVRNNLFEPVINAFLANGDRYNLLNSAVLEMLEFIRKENMKPLVKHLVEGFYPRLAACDYVDTFKNLKLKYEQNEWVGGGPENDAVPAAVTVAAQHALADARHRRDERSLDKDEEDYFSKEDDDEEEAAGASPRISNGTHPSVSGPFSVGSLVDYDDDDDEDAFDSTKGTHKRSPIRQQPGSPLKRPRITDDRPPRGLRLQSVEPANGGIPLWRSR